MLFKYLPVDRIDVLENLQIRFSPLLSLNDPFESQPLIDIKNKIDEVLQQQLEDLDEIWDNTAIEEKTPENRKLLEEIRSEVMGNAYSINNPSGLGKRLIDFLNDRFGVLCLSRTEDNLLMWSHYTDQGRGLVIGFDEQHEFFNQPTLSGQIKKPTPVIYTNKRSKVIPNEEKYFEKLFCEKPRDWAYEEEERLFRLCINKKNSISKDVYGMDIILSNLPKDAIKAVFVGYNSTEETKKKIFAAIKQHDIMCSVFQTRVSLNEYKIEFDEIAPEIV